MWGHWTWSLEEMCTNGSSTPLSIPQNYFSPPYLLLLTSFRISSSLSSIYMIESSWISLATQPYKPPPPIWHSLQTVSLKAKSHHLLKPLHCPLFIFTYKALDYLVSTDPWASSLVTQPPRTSTPIIQTFTVFPNIGYCSIPLHLCLFYSHSLGQPFLICSLSPALLRFSSNLFSRKLFLNSLGRLDVTHFYASSTCQHL